MNANLRPLAAEPKARQVLAAFAAAGVPVRFVGGCVRDALLGHPAADRDLATPARPEQVLQLLAGAGIRAIPTGLAHGTVTAVIDGAGFEITTLRRDVGTAGRHATVACTEDYLRILRFFRFSARYAGSLDGDGLAAAKAAAAELPRLSGERVRSELWKLLVAEHAVRIWTVMQDAGIVAALQLPATDIAGLARAAERERALGLVDPVRRFAALLPPLGADELQQIAQRLRLPNAERRRLSVLRPAEAGDLVRRVVDVAAGRFARALYGTDPADVLDAAVLDPALPASQVAALATFLQGWTPPQMPVGGSDLLAAGVPAGPQLGSLLAALEAWWVEQDFAPGRAELLQRLGRLPA
jgi:poly(A) polymerase